MDRDSDNRGGMDRLRGMGSVARTSGRQVNPEQEMDKVELLNGIGTMAEAVARLYSALLAEGFAQPQAMRLAEVWLAAVARGTPPPE